MTMHNHEPGEPLEGADVRLPALQSVADPAPLGLAAFAMTTFALSLMNANIWPAAIFPALALALVYGGFAQLLAGMWEFVRKNTFGALAFTSYGAFWISYYVFVKFLVGALKPALVPSAAGVFLLGWTIFTFYMLIASMRVSGAVVAVFFVLTITFVLLTIGAFNSNSTITHIGGWAGIVTAALAWYASAAGVINETFKKALVPVFPLAPR
jgi:hypothetical protein